MKKILVCFMVFNVLTVSPLFGKEYTLSMLPRYFPEKLTAMITPLASYLSKETGLNIVPVLTKNFADYQARILLNRNIAIGYENPVVYVKISSAHEVIATAIKGEGGKKFRGIVITRPDSGITDLFLLKGKKVMIVGKTSAGGYLSQKLTLQNMGIDVDRDCHISVAADNRQENVIISVSIGDVDAGFIRESAFHKADQFIRPGSVVSVAKTAWLPNWALSVDRNLPASIKQSIQKAVLKLQKNGNKVLKSMGLKAFVHATDSDYNIMRQFVR